MASVPDPPTTPTQPAQTWHPPLPPRPLAFSLLLVSFLGPSMLLVAPQRRVAGIKADGKGGGEGRHREAKLEAWPRDEGIHLLGGPRGSPPTKALVVLYLNPSLHPQGCSVFIGATQKLCTGSGAALRTCGAQTGLSGKQLGKLPGSPAETSQQSPSGYIRVPRASEPWSLASDFRIQTGLSCFMQPPSGCSPRGAALPCLVVYGFSVALRIPESCVKFGGAERHLHCFLLRI